MEQAKPSILDVLTHYGAEASRLPSPGGGWRSCLCPFHPDTRPSASVNTTLQAFRCHTCGVSGDSWKIIQEQEGLTFIEAKRFAETRFGYESGNVPEPVIRRRPYKPSWS